MGKGNELRVEKVQWEIEKTENNHLLREVYDLLLRKPPNLTNPQETDEMLPKMMKEKEGSKR